MSETIVHICPREDWEEAINQREYRSASLATDGFIHCSRPDQVLEVANRYYQGDKDLVLLWINPKMLKTEVRWEESDGDVFPHIYGVLNLGAIIGVHEFNSGADGIYRNLPSL